MGERSIAVPVFLDVPLEAVHKRPMPTGLEICKFTAMVVVSPPVCDLENYTPGFLRRTVESGLTKDFFED